METPSWASRQPVGLPLQRSGQDSQNTGTVANVRTVKIHAQSHRTNYRHSHQGQDSQNTGTVTKVRTVKYRHSHRGQDSLNTVTEVRTVKLQAQSQRSGQSK